MAISVIPDGCVDLIWRNGRLVVAGPDLTAARSLLRPGDPIIGLRFQPGAAAAWLGLPMNAIVGQQIEMADVWGARARRIAEIVGEQANVRARVSIFQREVAKASGDVGAPPRRAMAMFGFLAKNDGTARISTLSDRLNMSERTLRRWSDYHFGYGPKTLDRILRLQRLRRLAETRSCPHLADLALQAGYADQAHMNREVRSLCDMTPLEFVRQLAD